MVFFNDKISIYCLASGIADYFFWKIEMGITKHIYAWKKVH